METLYTEIFYDVKKNKSISEIKCELSNIAEIYGAEDNYNLHEIEGFIKLYRFFKIYQKKKLFTCKCNLLQ